MSNLGRPTARRSSRAWATSSRCVRIVLPLTWNWPVGGGAAGGLGRTARPPGEDGPTVEFHPAGLGSRPRRLVGGARVVAGGSRRRGQRPLRLRGCRLHPSVGAPGRARRVADEPQSPLDAGRAALALVATIVAVNHDELRDQVELRVYKAERAEIAQYELEAAGLVDPTRRLPPRWPGSPAGLPGEGGAPLRIADRSERTRRGDHRTRRVAGADRRPGADGRRRVRIRTREPVLRRRSGAAHGDQRPLVRARRFGSSMVDLRQVPAGRSAAVHLAVPSIFLHPVDDRCARGVHPR